MGAIGGSLGPLRNPGVAPGDPLGSFWVPLGRQGGPLCRLLCACVGKMCAWTEVFRILGENLWFSRSWNLKNHAFRCRGVSKSGFRGNHRHVVKNDALGRCLGAFGHLLGALGVTFGVIWGHFFSFFRAWGKGLKIYDFLGIPWKSPG